MSSNGVTIITGCSSGIGLASAIAVAKAGIRTIATVRNEKGAEPLKKAASEAGVELDIRFVDIVDRAAVDGLIGEALADYGSIDAVVNNAGVALVGTTEQIDIDALRRVMEVNFFGAFHVVQASLPALRSSGGRLVVVTSSSSIVGQPYNDGYCASKFAIEGLLESMAPVVAQHGVSVTMIEPGPVKTSLVANFEAVRAADRPGTPYPDPVEFLKGLIGSVPAGQQPEEIGQIVLDAITRENPPVRIQTSDWVRDYLGTKLADLDGAKLFAANSAWLG